MMLLLMWAAFLLHAAASEFATVLKPHYAGNLKTSCDALLYRSVYHETQSEASCYFVIKADLDSVETTKLCSRILAGAKLTGKAPDAVYSKVFANKTEFLGEDESTGKIKKAMCVYASRFPCLTPSVSSPDSGTCAHQEHQKISYRMHWPYRVMLKERLQPGQLIHMKGVLYGLGQPWSINLGASNMMSQWHLHFVVNYGIGHLGLGLTYLHNGAWQDWSVQRYPIPFTNGVPFDFRILVRSDAYEITVDGKHKYEWKHKLPIATVDQFSLNPHDENSIITYFSLGENYEPFPSPSAMANPFPICQQSQCMAKSRYACKSVVITGIFREGMGGPGQWTINFEMKPGGHSADHALRISPLIDNNYVILNSIRNGRWEQEVLIRQMPFKRNVRFEVTVTIGPTAFEIAVDGVHFTTFPHRFPPSKIDIVTTTRVDDVNIYVK